MKIRDIVPWKSGARIPVRKERGPFAFLQRDINRLFDDFIGDLPVPSFLPLGERSAEFAPRINVEDLDDKLVITAELPGMEQADVNISLSDDGLTISGEKKQEKKSEESGRTYYEASYGSFQRVIPLEDFEIEEAQVEAKMTKGVLTITLPKRAPTRKPGKIIHIKTE
jgi:HSP20 family protein